MKCVRKFHDITNFKTITSATLSISNYHTNLWHILGVLLLLCWWWCCCCLGGEIGVSLFCRWGRKEKPSLDSNDSMLRFLSLVGCQPLVEILYLLFFLMLSHSLLADLMLTFPQRIITEFKFLLIHFFHSYYTTI